VTNINGNSDWGIGDLLIFDGNISTWLKVDGSPSTEQVTLTDDGSNYTLIVVGVGPDLVIKTINCGLGVFCTKNATSLIIDNDNPVINSGLLAPTFRWKATPMAAIYDGGNPTVRSYVPNLNLGLNGCVYIVADNIYKVQCVIFATVEIGQNLRFNDVSDTPCPGILCVGPLGQKVSQLEFVDANSSDIKAGKGEVVALNWDGQNTESDYALSCGSVMITNEPTLDPLRLIFQVWWYDNNWGNTCIDTDYDQRITLTYTYRSS